jgi:NADH:ubiquinone oxidoreductase subunit F (NADH-binding)
MREEGLDKGKERKVEDIRRDAEEKACSVQKVLYFIKEFIAGPMCGKCYPCSLGTGEADIRLMRIIGYSSNADGSDIDAVRRIGMAMMDG